MIEIRYAIIYSNNFVFLPHTSGVISKQYGCGFFQICLTMLYHAMRINKQNIVVSPGEKPDSAYCNSWVPDNLGLVMKINKENTGVSPGERPDSAYYNSLVSANHELVLKINKENIVVSPGKMADMQCLL